MHPDLYIGVREGSAAYKKWYYEVQVTALVAPTGHTPHLRVGWAHAILFRPYSSSNGVHTLGEITSLPPTPTPPPSLPLDLLILFLLILKLENEIFWWHELPNTMIMAPDFQG